MDIEKRRISLSLKQAHGDPWHTAEAKYAKHSLVDGTVLSITTFGAFVELEEGVEGLVHISELSDKRVGEVSDVLKVGDQHQFRVLNVDTSQRRIRLSLKAVANPPSESTNAISGDDSGHSSPYRHGAKKKPSRPLKGGIE